MKQRITLHAGLFVICLLFPLIVAMGEEDSRPEPTATPDPEAMKTAAKTFFQNYVELSNSFSPNVADLYSNEAVIRNRRVYAWGSSKELTMPAADYKELIRTSMPLAKARGDKNTYTDVIFDVESDGVRIKTTRYSQLKDYKSPYSIKIRKTDAGQWLIIEELSESRP